VTANVRSKLTQQQIIAEQNVTFTTPTGTVTTPMRVTTQNAVSSSSRGWYLDLLQPGGVFQREMQVSDSTLRAGRVIFTTLIPDANPCSAGGTSWLMEMDSLSGGRLTEAPFDNNRDGRFTDADGQTITLADGSQIVIHYSGLQSDVGIAQTPGILSGDEGASRNKEWKYRSGSTPSAASGSNIQTVTENPGRRNRGRQSWRQIK
jgi:type IV pilus assembly protein PilY1